MKKLTDNTWENEIIDSGLLSIVNLGAVWCVTCADISPVFDEIAELYKDKINFAEMDVDECPKTTELLKIGGIPALAFVKKGKVKRVSHGMQDISQIKDAIEEVFKLEQ